MLVPSWVRDNVFFIGIRKNGKFSPRATGFFVAVEEGGWVFVYLVTAEHVVSGLLTKGHDIYIRANGKSGDVVEAQVPPDVWKFHPNENEKSDVAICPAPNDLTQLIQYNAMQLRGSKDIAANEAAINERNIGLGDEIFAVGLFRSHHGQERNVPVVRIGNIAAMRQEPVWTKYAGFIDAYLVGLQSVGGLSGSPVVVSMPPVRVVGSKSTFTSGKQFYLLGLMHGHFDIQNLNQDAVDDAHVASSINTGIGVVIPVEKIIETIDHPDLKTAREKWMAEKKIEGATPDAVSDLPDDHPPGDENPKHREDFTALLNAAAQKPKQDGQT